MAMSSEYGHNDGKGPADCAAHDLKDLMSRVMDQIADADRRNGDLLRQMQERLHHLGQQTRASRPSVPSEYLPGFDRIEDGMSLLAHRIAETYASRGTFAAHPVAPAAGSAVAASEVYAGSVIPAPAPAAMPAPAALLAATAPPPALPVPEPIIRNGHNGHDGYQPQPLRSSNAGVAAPRNGKFAPHVDTFDVVESVAGNPAEPWSPDQVAALSQIYQNRDTLFASQAKQTVTPGAPSQGPEGSGASGSSEQDRAWLEGRLADIAGRIEQSLTGGQSDQTMASIERRFNDLEHQMTSALRGLATVADVSGLHLIEAHIQDLNGKFDQVYAELMRLHAIEQQLDTIVTQVSDQRLSSLVEHVLSQAPAAPPAAAAPSHADFHGVAIAAAEAAAARVANAHSRTEAPGTRVDDVHAMLTSFIEERRQGDENTASALDTLQQAMLSMLDRMESMNDGRAGEHAPHGAGQGPEPAAAPSRQQQMAQNWTEAAPVLRTDPNAGDDVLDTVSRQRADLQASAQRAAAAQREKLKNQGTAGVAEPAGRNVRTAAGRKTAGSASSSRRLMVSGVALATAFTVGAGVLFSWMPNGAGTPVQVSAVPKAPGAATIPASLAAAGKPGEGALPAVPVVRAPDNQRPLPAPGQMAKAAPVPGQPDPTRSIPETVTEDIGGASEAPEVDRVPDTSRSSTGRGGQSNISRSSFEDGPAVSGIMIQAGRPAIDPNLAPSLEVVPEAATAIKIATNPAVAAQAPDTAGTPRAAIELPAASVGPNSLRLAAANGDPSAQFEVASRLAEGKSTDQNLQEAVRWYQRSATQGFAQAQYRLGTFYERGLGMKADLARARSWYQRAAEQGNVKAMHNLAVLSAGRAASAPDYATAVQWFTQAAGLGLADSQFNLAVLTESGLGVAKDPVQAAMWFILAAQSGDRESIRRRDLIKSKIDKTDLAAAEHLAKTWQAQVPDKLANDPKFAGEAWKARQAVAQE